MLPGHDKQLLSTRSRHPPPAYVLNNFALRYRSVAARLGRVAEHLEAMWLFAEHHEMLIYLTPLYEPGTLLPAENMTLLMCAI